MIPRMVPIWLFWEAVILNKNLHINLKINCAIIDENIETINNRLLISGPDTTKPYSSICIFSSNYKHKLWQIAFINKHLTKEKEQFWPTKYPAYPLCIAKGRHDLLTYHIQAFIGKHFIFIIFYFFKMFRNT